jgi:asparagine synthase (glutamine-hydrolysing)
MCGICGIINFNHQPVNETHIRTMMHIQKHRGPDDEGLFIEENIGIGFVRLSIIDLSVAGHQPMFSADNRYVIVFNGEVYNYLELREELITFGYLFKTNTDTEVVLTAWMHWGENCMHRFNGMWSFCIFDRLEKKVFAARDRYGIKPFYYYHSDSVLAFASEIPPLLSLIESKPTPDNQSIFDYIVFNRTDQTERTFFNEIKKLQHGHCLSFTIRDSNFNIDTCIKRWYNLKERVSHTVGFTNPEEYRTLFNSAVGLRLRSDVPVGVCLSGGLDSSSIVSVLLKDFNKSDLNTFSAVYNKGQSGDETAFIKLYEPALRNMYYTTPDANTFVTDLNTFIKIHAEPIAGTSPYAQYKVMELAKEHVVVTLDGQGADEQLAGYHYFYGFFFKDLLKHLRLGKLVSEMLHYFFRHHSFLGIKSFTYLLLPQRVRTHVRVGENYYINPEFVSKYKDTNTISANLYGASSLKEALIDHFEYKLEHLLKWEDRNSMHFSLEARVPFLDYRLVEKTLATTGDNMIRSGNTKHLLREATKGLLPEEIRMRKDKVGFSTPQDEWFRGEVWQKFINNIFQSETFKSRQFIKPELVKDLYNNHLSGKVNNSKTIWKLIHLELWFREFIDN